MNVIRRMLLVSVAAILVSVAVAPQEAYADFSRFNREFSALYVFGDSLSDPGNAWVLTGETTTAPYAPVPDYPYDSHRFSNGKTWAEVLANELGNYRGGRPAYKSRWFGNYAVGGARAQGSNELKPTFGDQVQMYLGRTGGVADPNALYVVQFGGNDIRDALTAGQTLAAGYPAEDPTVIIGNAIYATGYYIAMLRQAGATRFLIANAPNLGKVPVINALGAAVPAEALSVAYNFYLDQLLVGLAASGLEVYRLDMFSFIDVATAMPQGLGFADAATPCLQVFTAPATGVCDDPDQRLFWDGIHPTRAGHRLVGNIAVNMLSLD